MSLLPQTESTDDRLLARALELAQTSAAFASPNPAVGCVIAKGSHVLGEGAHRYDEKDHAEIVALKHATAQGHSVHGATAYVTLEPCSHHGRTPPCADALLQAGIMRCVVATVDPNPMVRGHGLEKLHSGGVEVDLADIASPLAMEARRLNDAFAFSVQHGRPFVTLKAALSVDGKLAPPHAARRKVAPHWITGEAARADVQHLRHASDAVLTGIGTVLADDPMLTDRTGLERRKPLLRVVLDSELRLPLDSALVKSAAADVLVFCSQHADAVLEAALIAASVKVHRIPSKDIHLDLAVVFAELARRDVRSVLVEGGSTVNGSLLRAGLADRLVLYYAESELGLDALPFAVGYNSPYAVQQDLTSVTRAAFPHGEAEDVRITGYLRDPWDGID